MMNLIKERRVVEQTNFANPGALAIFSPLHEYRYLLRRRIRNGSDLRCLFIMCNPSKADAFRLDNTVSRCCEFARMWGFGWLEVVNIFALCSTDPKAIRTHGDPKGEWNDIFIGDAIQRADRTVCAWGNHGEFMRRGEEVNALIHVKGIAALCLGFTASGQPKHPLARGKSWIPYDAPLLPYAA